MATQAKAPVEWTLDEPQPAAATPKKQCIPAGANEEFVQLHETIMAYPWDGAVALYQTLVRRYGYIAAQKIKTPFGEMTPQEIAVETGPDTKVMVPWGFFQFPLGSSDEYFSTEAGHKKGMIVFKVGAHLRRKWKNEFDEIIADTRRYLADNSIYRGKALRIEFTDEAGDQHHLPQPQFIDVSEVNVEEMVYTRDLTEVIDTNIFTMLRDTEAVRASGIPLKRGILAAGTYGTGKSLLARATAKIGTENGWTFIYIKNAAELPYAVNFAQAYQPCVVFAEDVDRFVAGERTEEMDQILNTLDGIDNKQQELMVILTSNNAQSLNDAMKRPGRLDVKLHIVPPDAEAVERLLRVYGKQAIDTTTDLREVSQMLAGFTPAIIREAVERSKLAAIRRTHKANALIESADIMIAAKTIRQEQEIMQSPKSEPRTWGDEMVAQVSERVHEKLVANSLGDISHNVKVIGRDAGVQMR